MSEQKVESNVTDPDGEASVMMDVQQQQSVTVADMDTLLASVDQKTESADNEQTASTSSADYLSDTANHNSVQPAVLSAVLEQSEEIVDVPVSQPTSSMLASTGQSIQIVPDLSSSGQISRVSLAAKGPTFVLCQVTSGGQTVIVPRSTEGSITLSSCTAASSTASVTHVPVFRPAVPLQTVSSDMQRVGTLTSKSSTATPMLVTQTSAGIRLLRQSADGVRVISGTTNTANRASLGVMLKRGAAPQRLAVAIAPANNTLRPTGTGSVRLVAIRTPVTIGGVSTSGTAVASPQLKLLTPAVPLSCVRPVTTPTAGVATVASTLTASANTLSAVRQQTAVNDVQAYLRRIEQLKSSQPEQGTKSPVTLTATVRTPLKSKTHTVLPSLTSAQQIVVLQSGSQTQLANISAAQLGNVLRAPTVSTQGTTVYMLTNSVNTSQLSSASLTAAIARAKVASSTGVVQPKVTTVGSLQAIRPNVSGSSAIIVDARHTVSLSKAEQNQSKANRIVAEAIAKAQAEGISVDNVAIDTDSKKKRRKKPGEADGDEAPPTKKKRPPRPRTTVQGRKGLKDDLGDEMIADIAADGLAVSEECEVLTSDVADMPKLIGRGGIRSLSKLKSKKRRPLPTFLKNKKRRKGGSDSDLSDREATPSGSGIDDETLQLLQGAGTEEGTLIEILCSRSNDEIKEISEAYSTEFGRKLEEDLMSETSGHFKRLLVAQCNADRDDSSTVDYAKAQCDASDIFEAGEGQLGTDESTFNMVLCERSAAQLRATFNAYSQLTDRDIEDAVKSETSGVLQDGYLAIVKYCKDSGVFFAERLYNSMKGAGTSDSTLIRLIVTRSECDLAAVANVFSNLYGQSLSEFISSDCDGDYKRLLIAVAGNC